MKKYNKPSIKVTAYVTINTTNLDLEVSSPIAIYTDPDKMDSGTFKLNDLNS